MTLSQEIKDVVDEAASTSNCQRRAVGCALFTSTGKIIVKASNGSDHPAYCQRPDKRGDCGCLHAEVRAALMERGGHKPVTAVISAAPCERCAKVLAAIGVRFLYYYEDSWPQEEGFVVLRDAGIQWIKVSVPNPT